jgi:4-amino-4-deoxy-L-arabinose transferase-like glycosyltransferase
VIALYFYDLNGVGVLGPDEPRYAAIGRAMAETRDFVTPRLWGAPWFEKPPLLYWMTAFGAAIGLGPDLAGRIPVVILSLAFLGVLVWLLSREFGFEAAVISSALLATSAGWLAYSSLCLTDLPLAVFFSGAVLLALPFVEAAPKAQLDDRWRFAAIGICLGLAILAKGLVPLALALPLAWYLRAHWRKWWLMALWCLVIAGPWYAAVYARNGYPFFEEFFLKHHFARLYSVTLQHVQPWYYYIPVFLGALFPWFPLVGLLALRQEVWDQRRRFLAAVTVFGFVFFSSSLNKLPGYLLPLLPSAFALIGSQFQSRRFFTLPRPWLAACAVLVALIPLLTSIIPQILRGGHVSLRLARYLSPTDIFYWMAPLVVVFVARRSWTGILLVLCVVSGGLYLKEAVYPILEKEVSARGQWRQLKDRRGTLCDAGLNRNWQYGFAFYRGALLPKCVGSQMETELHQKGNETPQVKRLDKAK